MSKTRTDQRAHDYENIMRHRANSGLLRYWVNHNARLYKCSLSRNDRENSNAIIAAAESVLYERGLKIYWEGNEYALISANAKIGGDCGSTS